MEKPIVIIPAAGKSSRFLGDSPKMLRTHPDGSLMIQKSLETFHLMEIEKFYLITTKELYENYELETKFQQAIPDLIIITLDVQTNSSVETVYEGIKKIEGGINLSTPIFIKDVDNFVEFDIHDFDFNFSASVGLDLNKYPVSKVINKSFLIIENDFIIDFIEKKIISSFISVGTHYFKNLSEFLVTAGKLLKKHANDQKELYMSHVISSNIYDGINYKFIEAKKYLDFGTQDEWELERKRYVTIFCDFDGTLVENVGKYGSKSWRNRDDSPLTDNLLTLKKKSDKGAQIIITTSRPHSESQYISDFLKQYGIGAFSIICGLNHSQRIIINDFNDTNIFPTAKAINIKRNSNLSDYLNDYSE